MNTCLQIMASANLGWGFIATAACVIDKTIRVWKWRDAKEVSLLAGHTSTVRVLNGLRTPKLSPSQPANRIVSGHSCGKIFVWDWAKRVMLHSLAGTHYGHRTRSWINEDSDLSGAM